MHTVSELKINKKSRLDVVLVAKGLVLSRSQGESYIKLGKVTVNGNIVKRAGTLVRETDNIVLTLAEQYVSRAGLKLASVSSILGLQFKDKTVLDIGSSTGGFTDYSLKHGAKKVVAVELGKNQLHPSLHKDSRVELHEQTDIRSYAANLELYKDFDIMVADISFMSLRDILPSIIKIANPSTQIVAMVKPQFEAIKSFQKHHGVIKNERIRRDILQDFEIWVKDKFVIINKADSDIPGAKGNQERFYLLKIKP